MLDGSCYQSMLQVCATQSYVCFGGSLFGQPTRFAFHFSKIESMHDSDDGCPPFLSLVSFLFLQTLYVSCTLTCSTLELVLPLQPREASHQQAHRPSTDSRLGTGIGPSSSSPWRRSITTTMTKIRASALCSTRPRSLHAQHDCPHTSLSRIAPLSPPLSR